MHSPFKKTQYYEDINLSLYKTIYTKVIKEKHKRENPTQDRSLKKSIELLIEGADPNILSVLEKSLSKQIESAKSPKSKEKYQKYYNYYIENFLSALKTEIIKSEELAVPSIINKKIKQPQKLQTIRVKILEIILWITNKSRDKNYSSSTIQNQSNHENGQIDRQDNVNTPKLSSYSNSVVSLPGLSYKSLESLVNSKSSSATSIASISSNESLESALSSIEGDNDPQIDNEEKPRLEHPTKTRTKGPSQQRLPFKWIKDRVQSEQTLLEEPQAQKSGNLVGQADPGQVEEELKLNGEEFKPVLPGEEGLKSEKEGDRKNATITVQKSPVNRNNSEGTSPKKQPNNRGLCKALSTGCTGLAVGYLVARVISFWVIGAVLFGMAAMFAIAAVVTLCLTPPSSELSSTNSSPLIGVKQR
ncbi:hypothetical protein [Wolbachia pipientis]|uniref:hypothetical protein n=1 Tax=Wolbachia pipientis TaxID=955 RepID=UPI0025A31C53|nr:hypothetical protein [Wolbachia pipientis]MDM8335462.1 hypothetical protein [Wolbachia pipientis]